MIKERLNLLRLIVYFLKNNKFDELKKALVRIRKEGKLQFVISNLDLIKKILASYLGYKLLNIETAFENKMINDMINKIYKDNSKVLVENLKINHNLILGFVIRENNIEINYSLKNIIEKIKEKWMT
jgi:vacuolar-type H+-ATPase subunit E/Vma4